MIDSTDLSDTVRERAIEVGFDAVGICSAGVLEPERERYLRWISEQRQGEMKWITEEWAYRASDPTTLLPGSRSVICVALSYSGPPRERECKGRGRIARYASGPDYHTVLRDRLTELGRLIRDLGGNTRPFVDTAPTMDKALAVRAGLGWQGKNTNVLSRNLGSFFFLGGVITDLDLRPDVPVTDSCGTCRACVAACPTEALKGDHTLDARLCISYLTIEHRGPIPRELRSKMGDWVFGCDICQDVCPVVWEVQDRDHPDLVEQRIELVRSIMQ